MAPSGPVAEGDEPSGLNVPGTTPPVFTRMAPPPHSPQEPGFGVFHIWVIIYGLVGAQMGWLLRPFIGHPNMPFEWFRARQGNFFQSVWHQLEKLMGG